MSQPRHGYELYQELSRELGWVWRIGLSQLYAQLKQLEADGLVTARAELQATRPSRKVYHLTPVGQEAFLDWLHQPSRHIRDIRLEFLARLYFFRRLALPGLEQLVAAQKAVCQAQVEALAGSTVERDDAFGRLVIEFRQGQLRAIIDWLDRCLETP